MADFEELKLTVTLVDDASAGLTAIRTQLTQLTQTAGQVSTALSGVATSAQAAGRAHQQAAPHATTQEKALKELQRSAEETTRGLLQMGLAARRGAEAFPELILATREAWTGLKGVNVSMTELGAASRVMVLGLGGVALGIAAVGAAVVAYGISVFKFSQEMYTLSQTAKSLGMTFGQLKNMTEQNERFGLSVGETTSQIAGMNDVLADLALSGSKVRQQMLQSGIPAQTITDYQKLTNEVDRYNKVREFEIQVHDDWLKKTGSEEIASVRAAGVGRMFGARGDEWTREAMPKPTAEELEMAAKIATQSAEIAKSWREISTIVSHIKDVFYSFGLEKVNQALQKMLELMGGPKALPESGPNAPHLTIPEQLKRDRQRRREADPMFAPTSFGGNESGGGGAQAIIKAGVYEALVDFATFMRTGGPAGGHGGMTPASFGGSAGAAGARAPGAAGFGGGGYANLGAGGGGGGGGGARSPIPSDAEMAEKDKQWFKGGHVGTPAETSSQTVTGAQGGSDLDKDAYDKMFKGTPMEGKYDKVVEEAKKNNISPSMMAGIIAHETGRGTSAMLRDKNNPAGLMDPKTGASTGQSFPNVDAGIEEAGRRIASNYQKGGGTIAGMAKSYAPVGAANDPGGKNAGWASGVTKYQNELGTTAPSDTPAAPSRSVAPSSNLSGGLPFAERGDVSTFLNPSSIAGRSGIPGGGARTLTPEMLQAWGETRDLGGVGRNTQSPGGALTAEGLRAAGRGIFDRRSSQMSRDLGIDDIDRAALNRTTDVNHKGKLAVEVNAAGGSVPYHGQNLLKNTAPQRQTQMMPTDVGPTVADTAQSYMRGGT